MASSGYEVADVGGAAVASGYVRRSSGWVHEEIAASGAFSPMGGLLSTVNDLARWVGVLQSVHGADQRESGATPPISLSSLREMQVTQRLVAAVAGREPGAAPEVTGYGFGLFEDFRSWGRTRLPLRWVSGLRVAHALAPSVRARDRRARQRHLCTDVHGRHSRPPGAGRGARRTATRRTPGATEPASWRAMSSPSGWSPTTRTVSVAPGCASSVPTTSSRTCRGPSDWSSGRELRRSHGPAGCCRWLGIPAVTGVDPVARRGDEPARTGAGDRDGGPPRPDSAAVGRAARRRPDHTDTTGRHGSPLSRHHLRPAAW